MDFFEIIWDYILHLDSNLGSLISTSGVWVYIIMAFVVFAETAFVVTVFLPSDTILFAACALSAVNNSLNFPLMLIIFLVSAAAGDSINFTFGKKLRARVEQKQKLLFIKKENLQKADSYYKRNGNMTLITARFIPILRSLAPFIAGMSDRGYKKFLPYNLIGVVVWCIFFCCLGYFFGNMPFVKQNYALIVFGIGIMSFFTAAISAILSKIFAKKNPDKTENTTEK